MLRKLIITAIGLCFLLLVGLPKRTNSTLPVISYQPRPPEIIPLLPPVVVEAQTIQPDIPISMTIPSINLNASVDVVGLTSEHIVDTPAQDIGWFNGSAMPGVKGTAAFNGHVQDSHFHPGVFAKLAQVKIGDEIIITDKKQQQFHYHVSKTELVNVNQFPTQDVYGQTNDTRITLVTCAGHYDVRTKDFTQRTIVFADISN